MSELIGQDGADPSAALCQVRSKTESSFGVATGKDVLSKFVHGTTNESAARKAVELLDKCGVKGVGTRGSFYDKLKSVVMGILIWKMVGDACALADIMAFLAIRLFPVHVA